MSRKHTKHIRKPMPSPSVAHDSSMQRVDESMLKKQVDEGLNWHSDPADEGWDWAGPSERDQRLWKIE